MREQLLGYLIGALDDAEHSQVEEEIRKNRQHQRELELLHESLEPLRAGECDHEPPAGLAARTCQLIAQRREKAKPAPTISPGSAIEPLGATSQWSFADMAVAAGIFLAAGMLLLPAIQQSRVIAQRTGCQNNLREIGQALQKYSETRDGIFPEIPAEGNQSVAGIFSVRLMEGGFLERPDQLLCPSARAGNDEEFRLPTSSEIDQAVGQRLVQLQRMLGGNFGYSLGYRDRGRYRPPRNLGRANFALVADAPDDALNGFRSANHGGCGQNVLYEDGHVDYLKDCAVGDCADHIFLNDENIMAAGLHPNDAVIGHSWSRPILESVRYGAAALAP